MSLLIRNGLIIDPAQNINQIVDLYIENDKIKAIGQNLSCTPERTIDATGCVVMPGLVDMHCHLREPGFEYKEDIASGAAAAAAGGFTSVACMANTNPVADNPQVIEFIQNRAKAICKAKVYPIGAITQGLNGEQLSEMGFLKKCGVTALSDDGRPVANAQIMRMALSYARNFDLLLISHCEEMPLVNGGVMNEGYQSTVLGLKGIPRAAEEIMISRDILLAEMLKTRVHIAHVSTQGAVELVRAAKARGVQVTCETAPHYFSATDALCDEYNTFAKVNPPLRTDSDVQAIIAGLLDGTIDCIATDHAPHHADEKNIEFQKAANGISGFETAFSLAVTNLLNAGASMPDIVRWMSSAPTNILGINAGTLAEGQPADVTIADIDATWTVDPQRFVSKGKNSPFGGRTLRGVIRKTIVDGRIVYSNGGDV